MSKKTGASLASLVPLALTLVVVLGVLGAGPDADVRLSGSGSVDHAASVSMAAAPGLGAEVSADQCLASVPTAPDVTELLGLGPAGLNCVPCYAICGGPACTISCNPCRCLACD